MLKTPYPLFQKSQYCVSPLKAWTTSVHIFIHYISLQMVAWCMRCELDVTHWRCSVKGPDGNHVIEFIPKMLYLGEVWRREGRSKMSILFISDTVYTVLRCFDRNAFFTFRTTEKISCMVLSKCMWCADVFVWQHFYSICTKSFNLTNNSETDASAFMDLKLSISNDIVYPKFKINVMILISYFEIVMFLSLHTKNVYISKLIWFARASSHVADLNTHNKLLTQSLLKQGFRYYLFVLFDLILYVPPIIIQLNRDGSSWVEPVLS